MKNLEGNKLTNIDESMQVSILDTRVGYTLLKTERHYC